MLVAAYGETTLEAIDVAEAETEGLSGATRPREPHACAQAMPATAGTTDASVRTVARVG